MPLTTRMKSSLASAEWPAEARFAPFALIALAQPFPAEPLFPHGHGVPAPVPKQYGVDECQPSSTPYCFGTGAGTPCPCGNNGSAGNGCANAINANGANLASAGHSALANDDFILVVSGMPDNSCLYFQGTTQINGG